MSNCKYFTAAAFFGGECVCVCLCVCVCVGGGGGGCLWEWGGLCIWMKFLAILATANNKFGIGNDVLYLFILI